MALAWALSGCLFNPPTVDWLDDAGGAEDAAVVLDADVGVPPEDSGVGIDSGVIDTGTPDAGVDAGLEDAGPTDAEPTDTGPTDAGPTDAEPPDADPVDTGPVELCGDGVVQAGEACDDMNQVAGDGCNLSCAVEDGWYCDDQAPSHCAQLPVLTIGGATVLEGEEATVVVTLSVPAPLPVELRWSTVDGTAVATADYTPKSGVLVTIPVGGQSADLLIQTAADGVPELTETFSVELAAITNAVPGATSATVDVGDDNPLVERGLVARYFLDEAGPMDSPPASVHDAAPDPLDLTVYYNGGTPDFIELGTGRGMEWSQDGRNGRAEASTNNKVRTRLDGSRTATLEVVTQVLADSNASRLLYVGGSSGWGDLAMLIAGNYLYLGFDGSSFTWSIPTNARRQHVVFTIVVDSTRQNSDDRRIAYVNGQSMGNGSGFLSSDRTTAVPSTHALVIGNTMGGGRSPEGHITYSAIYDEALTPAEVQQNAALLLQRDDAW